MEVARTSSSASRHLLFAVLCFVQLLGHAQTDSSAIYDRIREYAKKRKVTEVLHDAIFVDPPENAEIAPTKKGVPKDNYQRYKGRSIGRIHIHVLDPFASDVSDTLIRPTNWIERVGNGAHISTREFVVRRLLLFKEGDVLDPLELRESERLLRSYSEANDARITILPDRGGKGDVDILVVLQDRWSLEVGASGDLSSANARITENNLFGFGQLLEQEVSYDLGRKRPVLKGSHRIYNIDESYVSSTLSYQASQELDQILLSLDRPFFSPLTKWAGNATGSHSWYRPDQDPRYSDQLRGTIQTTRYDLWAGLSLKASVDTSTKGRSERIVLAARYIDQSYQLSPTLRDSLRYPDGRTALVSVQLSEQRFSKDRYLYRFGSTEDVALGQLIALTTGVSWSPGAPPIPYSGIAISHAELSEKGRYALFTFGLGTYWRNGKSTSAQAGISFYGFSELLDLGQWKLRQFITTTYAKSIRPSSPGTMDLSGDQLVRMNASGWYGDQKLLLRTESVAYAPYSLLGFRFAPVLVMALGTLGAEHERLDRTTYQSAFGFGLLIRNERLLSSTFRISFAFYPGLPASWGDPFRYNALNSLSLRSPSLAPGAPDVVGIP